MVTVTDLQRFLVCGTANRVNLRELKVPSTSTYSTSFKITCQLVFIPFT